MKDFQDSTAILALLLAVVPAAALPAVDAIHTMSISSAEGILPRVHPELAAQVESGTASDSKKDWYLDLSRRYPALPYLPWWPDPGGFLDNSSADQQDDALSCAPRYLTECRAGGVPLVPPQSNTALCVPAASAPFLREAGYLPPLPPVPAAAPLELSETPTSMAALAGLFSEAGGMEAVAGPLRSTAAAINAAGVWELKTQQLGRQGGIVLSPPALHTSYAILHEGARGDAADDLRYGTSRNYEMGPDEMAFFVGRHMEYGFGFDPDPETRHDAAARLASYLNTDVHGSAKTSLSSSLWIDDGFETDAHFADIARRTYAASLKTAEHRNGSAAQGEVDAWLENRIGSATGGADPGSGHAQLPLEPDDLFYYDLRLVNAPHYEMAVYIATAATFVARWETPFRSGHSEAGPPMRGEHERQQQPSMLHTSGLFEYAHSHGTQVVRLPYEGGRFSMIVMLPDDRAWDRRHEYPVYPGQIEQWLGEAKPAYLEVAMPEFAMTDARSGYTRFGLLSALSGSAPPDSLRCLGHPATDIVTNYDRGFVSVDAEGTRAAHGTQAILSYGSWAWGGAGVGPPALSGLQVAQAEADLPRLVVDRPFMFAVYDEPAGMILFLGQVPYGVLT